MLTLSSSLIHLPTPKRFPIAVEGLLEPVRVVQPGCYFQVEKSNLLVCLFLFCIQEKKLITVLDFLSIRKIPLKQKPYLLGNGKKFSQQLDDTRPVDPDVDLFLNQTRTFLQTDRAIHDQAGTFTDVVVEHLLRPIFIVHEGLRFLRPRLLQARSLIHFPDKRP